MGRCSVSKCKNIGTHRFPKEPNRRKQWENALRIKDFKANNTSRLCAAHFKESDYFGKSKYTIQEQPLRMFLKKDAIPIPVFTEKASNPNTLERQLRLEKRCQRKLFREQDLQPSTSHTMPSVKEDENHLIPELGFEEVIVSGSEQHVGQNTLLTEETVLSPAIPDVVQFSCKSTQVDHEHTYGSIKRYTQDDKAIHFYTGFESYEKFKFVFATLSPMAYKIRYFRKNVINLSTEDQFFLTLMKLRQNKCNYELGKFFNISETTVSNIFITWVNYIYQLWSRLNIWPSKELVKYYMPHHFKLYDENIRIILDGTEITVQKPKNPTSQQASWSSYKHANTLKILVGATPGGLLSYCSQAYAGSISDRQTVERSDLITKCESGDSILADRGFTIQDMFAHRNITVKIPAFLKGKSQLPGITVLKDRELASKRVHIERIIGLTKTYKILKSELDHSYVTIASKIFFICFMCCNFRKCIMSKENKRKI